MPAILIALQSLIALVIQQAGPAAVGILTEWISRNREAAHHADPQLVVQLERHLASPDDHALSVFLVQLYNRVGTDPAGEPGSDDRFKDRVQDRGPSVAGSSS